MERYVRVRPIIIITNYLECGRFYRKLFSYYHIKLQTLEYLKAIRTVSDYVNRIILALLK